MNHTTMTRLLATLIATAALSGAHSAETEEIDLSAVDDTAEAVAAKPEVAKTDDGYVDVRFEDATIASVLQQFRRATKMNILSGDSTNLNRKVSASLTHVRWVDAIRSILGLADFKIDQRGDIWYVNEKTEAEVKNMTRYYVLKHASAVDLADLFNGAAMKTTYADRNSIRGTSSSDSADSKAKKDNGTADPHSALAGRAKATAFPNTNTLVLTGPEANLIECENIINELDRPVTQVYIEARFIELSSEAMHKLGVQWDQLKSWGASVKNIKAGYESNDGKAANYGDGLTQRTSNNNDTKSNNKSDSSSENGSQSNSLSDDSSSASSSKSNNKSNNTTENDNSTSSDNSTFAGLFPSAIGEATGAGASAASMGWRNATTFSGQFSADDFNLAISAFENLQEGKLFSNPRIIVANGKEAKVDMTRKEPNVEVRSSRSGTEGQSLDISTKLETIPGQDRNLFAGEAFFSYGITLSVKPRVSPAGLISVEVVPTISEKYADKVVSGSGTSDAIYTTYPVIDVKTINTEFTMKDGATAVIGGLTQTKETDVDSGIPYLRKIPWIGKKLFGWQSREKVQTEILVCVTVGIANPETLPKDAGLPTNAVLGREYVEGRRLEPGLRPNAIREISNVDTRSLDEIHEDPYFMKDEAGAADDGDEGVDLEDKAPTKKEPAKKEEESEKKGK